MEDRVLNRRAVGEERYATHGNTEILKEKLHLSHSRPSVSKW